MIPALLQLGGFCIDGVMTNQRRLNGDARVFAQLHDDGSVLEASAKLGDLLLTQLFPFCFRRAFNLSLVDDIYGAFRAHVSFLEELASRQGGGNRPMLERTLGALSRSLAAELGAAAPSWFPASG